MKLSWLISCVAFHLQLDSAVSSLVYSQDGKLMASGYQNGIIHLWEGWCPKHKYLLPCNWMSSVSPCLHLLFLLPFPTQLVQRPNRNNPFGIKTYWIIYFYAWISTSLVNILFCHVAFLFPIVCCISDHFEDYIYLFVYFLSFCFVVLFFHLWTVFECAISSLSPTLNYMHTWWMQNSRL